MPTRTSQTAYTSSATEESAHQAKLLRRQATRQKTTPAAQLPRESETFYQRVIGKIPFAFNIGQLGNGETTITLNQVVAQDVFDAVVNRFRNSGWTVTCTLDAEDSLEGICVYDILTLTPPADWLNRLLPTN